MRVGTAFLWLAAASAFAGDDPPSDELVDAYGNRVVPLNLVTVADETWQSGNRYISAADWFALACDATRCALEPGRLTVSDEPKKSGDFSTDGQRLRFTRDAPVLPNVLAWLRGDENMPWLHQGAVTTYGTIVAGFPPPQTADTLELSVPTTAGESSRLVPLLDLAGDGRIADEYRLQLRAQGKRQILGTLWMCGHLNTHYLLWAGDLDGDGRPDYLISYVDGFGDAVLHLSSKAGENELVADGATFHDDSSMSNCHDETR